MYHKESEKVDFTQYIIGDAHHIAACADSSLDFIFSSHVFEHLMNPLGVLENWSRKLSTTGVVIGVVPDLRYCFDLRQPASTPNDWQDEYAAREWTLSRAKFEKWCRYTAPNATPDSLIERKYSIHAHYYTPTTMRTLLDMAIERGMFRKLFINTCPNNKDFAFVVWK